MARLTWVTLRDDIERVLGDPATTILPTAYIDAGMIDGLREISEYVPIIANHWLTARHRSRYVDISGIDNLLHVNYAIYPILLTDSDGDLIDDYDLDLNRRNVEHLGDTIRMGLNTAATAITSDDLTGTVTFSSGSTAISGSGTAFTTELRAGYHIKKSSSSTWYRVASITDATNLVLAAACLAADDGADTADATHYWRCDVIVNCAKGHYITDEVDLGAALLVGAHSLGAWSISIDAVGTGYIDKNMMFTIAGMDGEYRVTEDAAIAGNAATFTIEPALKGIGPDNALVSFKLSSLSPQLERLFTELVAARLAINLVGEGRTLILTDALGHIDTGDDLLNTITVAGGAESDYLRYVTARLGIANSLMAFSQWGWGKLQWTLAELSKLQRPRIFRTYPSD